MMGGPSLQELTISTTRRAPELSLPPDLAHLQALTRVSFTAIKSPLSALCALTNLQALELEDIRGSLNIIHSEVTSLARLTSLDLNTVALTGSVQSLSGLSSLKRFEARSVSGRPDVSSIARRLSDALAMLPTLEELDMMSCSVQPEFSALSRLTALTRLAYTVCDGEGNNARSLQAFQCCAGWQRLRSLILWGNSLVELPENLSCLSALVELDLSSQKADFQISATLDFMWHMPDLRRVNLKQIRKMDAHIGIGPAREWSARSLYFLTAAKARLARLPVQFKF